MRRLFEYCGIVFLFAACFFLIGCSKEKTLHEKSSRENRTLTPTKPHPAPVAEDVTLNPEKCVIVIPSEKSDKPYIAKYNSTTAAELQKHLKLVTGVEVPITTSDAIPAGKYPFYIQKVPADDTKAITPRASRWSVTPKGTYFYGEIIHGGYWSGARNAVYSFLEDQLSIRWTEPGDMGIAYRKQNPLTLKLGTFNWIPKLMFRTIRSRTKNIDNNLWKKRMRMGGSRPGGGHAFSTWWKKYGKTHPECFALNKFGKREPVLLPKANQTDEFVKICASNPAVVDQIVKDWLPRKKIRKYVSACMDDGTENFCECEKCKKLDILQKGEKFGEHMTDRYVYLANAVAREVKKHRADAWVTMYAYLTTMKPPRKIKLEPNIVVQAVPYVTPLDLTVQEDLFKAWNKAGAKKLALRPNYHHKYLRGPLPLGLEKQMFDVFQIVMRQGVVSADYDAFTDTWALTSLTNYVLAHAMAEPDKSFAYWANQYYQAYGPASEEIKNYYQYWRKEVFEKRLKPNLVKIAKIGKYGAFARGLMWSLHNNAYKRIKSYRPEVGDYYYNEEDFNKTDAMLAKAAEKNLTKEERYRVNQLIMANQRSRLVFNALTSPEPAKFAHALKLRKWMDEHKNAKLRVEPLGKRYVNSTGLKQCAILGDYPLPWLKTIFFWQFKMDPDNVGLKEKWQKKSWKETNKWTPIRVNVYWSNTYESPYKELKKKLKDYDGIGWYSFRFKTPTDMKGREIYLRFGAVDDSCWLFVNGKKAGEHIFKKKGDENAPFEIRIDQCLKWNADYQHVMLRVEDLGGKGGVHKPTWIVSKK